MSAVDAPHRLALGTVQWGLPYGVANRLGQPDDDEVARILRLAEAAGIAVLDTARGYGTAEEVVGRLTAGQPRWRVITKIAPILDPERATAAEAEHAAEQAVQASLEALRLDRLDTVLLHRPEHRKGCGGGVWTALKRLRDQGVIGRLGVSALEPRDAIEALDDDDVAVFQVAASVLDQRLLRAGFFDAARHRGREVFVRSAFLQGVAFLDAGSLPASLAALAPVLGALDTWGRARGLDRPAVFLGYARAAFDAGVVLGCEAAAQLRANLDAWEAAVLDPAALADLAATVPDLDERLLTPARWNLGG